jgi:hypothetical protein
VAIAWLEKKVCIVVKTYPTPATNGVEVSCTAGITEQGEWIRLFPVPFRFLEKDQRFKKYQWIQLRVKKASDPRPESFNIDPTSIRLMHDRQVSTSGSWKKRKDLVFPLAARSYCALKRERDDKGFPTLGFFKPKQILRLVIEKGAPVWSDAEKAKLEQKDLFDVGPVTQLQKIPYKFSYEFVCDDSECAGHTFMCSDWEMAEAFRQWRQKYGDKWEGAFRQKFETEMIKERDTHFYVGTIHQHPGAWIIVGLFYPPL